MQGARAEVKVGESGFLGLMFSALFVLGFQTVFALVQDVAASLLVS